MGTTVRLLLDSTSLAQKCTALLSGHAELEVVTAGRADVAIVDSQDGLVDSYCSAARRASPPMHLLLLSPGSSQLDCLCTILRGADGLLRYDECDAHLIVAVGQLAAGYVWFPNRALAGAALVNPFSAGSALTPRERDVALLRAKGLAIKEIAAMLKLRETSVKSHIHSAYRKLNVRSVSQLRGHLS